MTRLSARQLLNVLNNQWCDTKTLQLISACGKNKALDIKKRIKEELLKQDENYYLPQNLVPMEAVIKYLKINVNYLQKIGNCKGTYECENNDVYDKRLKNERKDNNDEKI